MKVLVLGGSGFIGSALVGGLLNQGHQVRVFDRNIEAVRQQFPDINDVVQADFVDVMSLTEAMSGVDIVFHLISTSVPATSNKNPVHDIESNLVNTVKLLELMRNADVKRIVYLSSGGTVYGTPKSLPITENHSTNPTCSYGIVKLAIEKYLLMYAELYQLDATILRPSNPYGPGQTHKGVQGFIGTCIDKINDGQPITVWGDGSVVRDYVYIDDVVSACLATMKGQQRGPLNISSGVGYSLNQIINMIEKYKGEEVEVVYQSKRSFDIPEVILDNQLAKKSLGWVPQTPIERGLNLTLQHGLK
ncbi:NAD-dependent epimerase/dehydratase family protein [Methylophaga nitratireducenticrescens]|uniref:UDP-glucose 4-epimerase n=1 Tax=Methylophaga nitratireducenticrescens TaxID=754476 RepID=I1XIM5_METNJ|nr:NAD-dependent epimerase/dehydratase family protein [Methylophaga nitratireducenticrescens]AFI84244.1 NAD-dependent epimerase [Methylophaga nitratireducenticrescens]AUZ84323.1 NAD-dependent epimerase [Methylophaga nitratireducenticrescens]